MIDSLLAIDQALFTLINNIELPAFTESFLITLTTLDRNPTFLYLGLPFVLAVWAYYERRRAGKVILALALVVGATDFICNRMIKKTVDRKRPNREKSLEVNLRLPYSPKGESFVSNHSANNFAAATVLTAYYPAYGLSYYAYASLVAFTRPYVGVHYPSDILVGGLIGHLIAFFMLKFWFRKRGWFEVRKTKASQESSVPISRDHNNE